MTAMHTERRIEIPMPINRGGDSMQHALIVLWSLVPFLAIGAPACSGDADDDDISDTPTGGTPDPGPGETSALTPSETPPGTPGPTPPQTSTPSPSRASATIGAAGGLLETPGGVILDIPHGALGSDVTFTIQEGSSPPPPGITAWSPVYEFEPSTVVFAIPATVTIPFTGTQAAGDPVRSRPTSPPPAAGSGAGVTDHTALFWSQLHGSGYDDLGGTVLGGAVISPVVALGSGFVGDGSGQSRTVVGSQGTTYITERNVFVDLPDLSSTTVRALVPDGQGGFASYPGQGYSDSTFRIPGVPDGWFYLQIANRYDVRSDSVIDLGYYVQGRPDVALATSDTWIDLEVSGMTPWQEGDWLQFISAGAAVYFEDLGWYFATPEVGADTLTDYVMNTKAYGLIEGDRGDTAVLTHLAGVTGPTGTRYLRLADMFVANPFTQSNGSSDTLEGDFSPVSATSSASLDIRVSQFSALAGQLNPNATWNFGVAGITALPGGLEYGSVGASEDLAVVWLEEGVDVATGIVSYGLPFPGEWEAAAGILIFYQVQLALPSSSPVSIYPFLSLSETVSSFSAGPVVPAISPVRNPRIGAQSLFSAMSPVGTSPTLTWEPPAIGTPTSYVVECYHLYSSAGKTGATWIGDLTTTDTRVTLPPGMLQAGQVYVFKVIARAQTPSLEVPSRTLFPDARACLVTGMVTA